METRIVDGHNLTFNKAGRLYRADSQMLQSAGLKYCPRCKQVKCRSEFYPNGSKRNRPDGLHPICRGCCIAMGDAYTLNARASNLNHKARERHGDSNRITRHQLKSILVDCGFRCAYCGLDIRDAHEFDHVVPQSRGGKNVIENIVPTCSICNRSKNDRSVEEWKAEMRARLEWMDANGVL